MACTAAKVVKGRDPRKDEDWAGPEETIYEVEQVLSMCPIGAYMCHRGRLGWSGTSGLRENKGTSTH